VPATIEWSPHVYGNGVMTMASAWPDPVEQDDGNVAIFETVLTAGVTPAAPVGAEKWSRDSETRSFTSDWTAEYPLPWAFHPVSAPSGNAVSVPEQLAAVLALRANRHAQSRSCGQEGRHTTGDDSSEGINKVVLVAAVLLGVAALAIAWSTYQEALWGGIQDCGVRLDGSMVPEK
jgi:hypothetical protein